MPYALVRGARNTMPIAPRRWHRGLRGLGQCVDPGSGDDVPCSDPGAIEYTQPSGETPTVNPLAGGTQPATGYITGAGTMLGSSEGCAPGYVVADNSGNCAPAANLAATLRTATGAASLGLSPSQAQSIAAALQTVTNTVKAATGQPTSYVAPASTNPFASISSTVWIAGAAVLALLLVLKSKR
jgi:hypothetical protein